VKAQYLLLKVIIGLIVHFSTHTVLALYAGANAGYHQVYIAGEKFYPASLRLHGGVWLWKGIGVEADIAAGITDDKSNRLTIDMPLTTSVYGRFQTTPDYGTITYLLLGYTSVELEGSLENNAFPGKERFSGGSAALGFMLPLSFHEGSSIGLEAGGHFVDNDIDIWNLSIGFHHEF